MCFFCYFKNMRTCFELGIVFKCQFYAVIPDSFGKCYKLQNNIGKKRNEYQKFKHAIVDI